jgi:hypothetical protein
LDLKETISSASWRIQPEDFFDLANPLTAEVIQIEHHHRAGRNTSDSKAVKPTAVRFLPALCRFQSGLAALQLRDEMFDVKSTPWRFSCMRQYWHRPCARDRTAPGCTAAADAITKEHPHPLGDKPLVDISTDEQCGSDSRQSRTHALPVRVAIDEYGGDNGPQTSKEFLISTYEIGLAKNASNQQIAKKASRSQRGSIANRPGQAG